MSKVPCKRGPPCPTENLGEEGTTPQTTTQPQYIQPQQPTQVTVNFPPRPKYQPLTKIYPPSGPITVPPLGKAYIIEHELSEGFVDFVYTNVNHGSNLSTVIELDGDQWLSLTPQQVNNTASGLGMDGWYGYIGSQVYSAIDGSYGISIVPTKDALPYYQTLRVWIENTSPTTTYNLIRCVVGWRKRIKD